MTDLMHRRPRFASFADARATVPGASGNGSYDWGGTQPFPYGMARAHFLGSLARRVGDGETVHQAQGGIYSESSAADLVPEGWTVNSSWSDGDDSFVVVGDGAERLAMIGASSYEGYVEVSVASPEQDAATIRDAILTIAGQNVRMVNDDPDLFEVRFWSESPMGGGMSYRRSLEVSTWADHRLSYADTPDDEAGTAGLRTRVDDMMGWRSGPPAGRLLLLHGVPGTGKTTLLSMLGDAWREWATVHYVVDPDRFFKSAAYMVQVMLGEDYGPPVSGDGPPIPQWRLIVVEDADELIDVTAKAQSGQNAGRLLNMTDGLIGRGLRVLVAITTNEPVGTLHPAMTRPGRCAANLHIGALSADDADAWRLARDLPATGEEATLAGLWEEVRSGKALAASAVTDRIRQIAAAR